jgi:tmRNA-binding protein
VELGLATSKQQHDKREDLKKRQHQRDIDRATDRRR